MQKKRKRAPYSKKTYENNVERTLLSEERTLYSKERTQLNEIGVGLAIIGLGVAMFQFADEPFQTAGIGLILFGIVFSSLVAYRFFELAQFVKKVEKQNKPYFSRLKRRMIKDEDD